MCSNINAVFYSTLVSEYSCCQPSQLLLAVIVHCVDNACSMKPKLNRMLASFLLQWGYSCFLFVMQIFFFTSRLESLV